MMTALKLVRKDMIVSKDYGIKYFVFVAVISFALSATFGPVYLYMISPILLARYFLAASLSLEEKNKGYLVMGLYPVSRRSIACSKYLLLLGLYMISVPLSLLIAYLGYRAGIYAYFQPVTLYIISAGFFITAVSEGASMPIVLKLGQTKGRFFSMALLILCFIAISILSEQQVVNVIFSAPFIVGNPGILPVLGLLASAAVLAVSYRLSVKILEAKDL